MPGRAVHSVRRAVGLAVERLEQTRDAVGRDGLGHAQHACVARRTRRPAAVGLARLEQLVQVGRHEQALGDHAPLDVRHAGRRVHEAARQRRAERRCRRREARFGRLRQAGSLEDFGERGGLVRILGVAAHEARPLRWVVVWHARARAQPTVGQLIHHLAAC